MNNILSSFPDPEALISNYPGINILEVNGHVHTPYSFSAFQNISEIFAMAQKEKVSVVGINDFFVSDGYDEFGKEALKNKVFPLFNIEFIGLIKELQQKNIRVNDPNNPGRCYFTGKGLNYPFKLDDKLNKKLQVVIAESQTQVKAMVTKANEWFATVNAGIVLDFTEIKKRYAKELVRERHIAKAIRIAVFEKAAEEDSKVQLFTKIYGGKEPKMPMDDIPGLENEIRGNLLKAGGKAFVEEDPKAFMSIDEVMEIIVNAGGIPCYPVLLDDKNENYTEFEAKAEELYKELTKRNIGCIELIPGRNEASHLKKFVEYFNHREFVILFGTEHNAPDMIPLTCDTRGKKPLRDDLRRISYEGACVIAAHQYLQAKGLPSFIDEKGKPRNEEKEEFIELGNAVIHHYLTR